MARETLIDSRQEILRTAARFFSSGYDATSMNDVAAALRSLARAVSTITFKARTRYCSRS